MKKGEFRQGEHYRFDAAERARKDGLVQHIKDHTQDKPKKSLEAVKRDTEKLNAERSKQEKQKAAAHLARKEKQHSGAAAEAFVRMVERQKKPYGQEDEQEPEYTTPGEAYDTFMQEPSGSKGSTEARARMIERMEKKDEERDKSRSLAQRSPHRDSREDALIAAALRDVRDTCGAKRQKPAGGQGAAEAARAAMIDRKTRK